MIERLNTKNASTLVNNSLRLNLSKSFPMLCTISAELYNSLVGRLNSLAPTYTFWLGYVLLT